MITITKKPVYSLMLPLLIANASTLSMDIVPASRNNIQLAHKIIYEPINPIALKAHFTGKIKLDDGPVGYGCTNCIDTLKKHNINTQQNWPLALVKFSVQIPKTNPQEEQKYCNITETVPSEAIEHAIQINLQQEIKRREQNILAILEGESDQLKNKTLRELAYESNLTIVKIKKIINDLEPIPGLLPAHLLYSPHSIVFKGLFAGSCDITFTFDEYQQLNTFAKQFQETPAVYTLLTSEEIDEISLAVETITDPAETLENLKDIYCDIANERSNQLEELEIIRQKIGVDGSLDLFPGDLFACSKEYEHGTNGRHNIEKLVQEQSLNGENPAHFVTKRQATGNKRTFTYGLKNK